MVNDKLKTEVGNSTNITIGGKKYSVYDISRLRQEVKVVNTVTGKEHIPRNIKKEVVNEAGKIQTNSKSTNQSFNTHLQGNNYSTNFNTSQIKVSQMARQPKTLRIDTSGINSKGGKVSLISTAITNKMRINTARKSVEDSTSKYMGTAVTSEKNIQTSSLRQPKNVTGIKTIKEDTETNNNQVKSVIAGRIRNARGAEVAYFSFADIEKYNNARVHVNIGNKIKTGSDIRIKSEEKTIESSLDLACKTNLMTDVKNNASFFLELSRYRNKSVGLVRDIHNELIAGSKQAIQSAKEMFNQQDDLGSELVGQGIETGIIAYKTLQTAQYVSDGLIKTGKGTWDVVTTVGLATLTISKSSMIIKDSFIPLNKEALNILRSQAIETGLNKTILSQTILHRVEAIYTSVNAIKTGLINAGKVIKEGSSKAHNVVRELSKGTLTVKIAKDRLEQLRKNNLLKLRYQKINDVKGLRNIVIRGSVKGCMWVTFKGVPLNAKLVRKELGNMTGWIAKSDDLGLQSLNNAIQVGEVGIKTVVIGTKMAGLGVQTGIKGGVITKNTTYTAWHTVAYIKNKGLKATWDRARRKIMQKTIKTSKSVVVLASNLIRTIGIKMVMPIILIIIITLSMSGVITTPLMAMGTIFGGVFGTSDTEVEYDIREYITNPENGIPKMSRMYIEELVEYLNNNFIENGGFYHDVRLFTNLTNTGEEVKITVEDITAIFPTTEALANIIQPIFNAVILMDYDLESTEAEAQALLQEIFDKLFRLDEESIVEWCTGVDENNNPITHDECGEVHSSLECLNSETGQHSTFTCSICCYTYCGGHTDGNGITTYCSGCISACSGYVYCRGHNVLIAKLNMDGIYQLLAEYFTDPINELSNIPNRTKEEEERLNYLKDYYEICLEYIALIGVEYGGLTTENLSGVKWVNGSRTPNKAIVDLALTQVGQIGGEPYWSYYGFASRVEWCACFVHWVMNTGGVGDLYAKSSNNAYCQTLANWFSDNGRWGATNFTDLVAGDTIFFDWQGDGHTDHIGIVIGRDEQNVYTVEGNSGDAVRVRQYPLNSSVIYGYGLMNY